MKFINETIPAAQEAALPDIIKSGKDHLAAQALQPQTERALHVAEDVVADIELAWKRHLFADDLPTPAEYAEAISNLAMQRLRRQGTKVLLDRTASALRSSDVTLAQAVEPVGAKAYPGAGLAVTFADVSQLPMPRASEYPIVVIGQTEATRVGKEGFLSGEVTFHYFRQDTHVPLDKKRIQDAADALDIGIEIAGVPRKVRGTGDRIHESVKVRVLGATSSLPYLPVVNSFDTHRLSSAFARSVAADINFYDGKLEAHSRSLSYASPLVVTIAGDTSTVSEVVGEDGKRELVIDSSVFVYVKDDSGPAKNVHERVTSLAEHFAGGVQIGLLGTVEGFELLPEPVPANPGEERRLQLARVQAIKGSPLANFQVNTGQELLLPIAEFKYRVTLVSTTRRPHREPVAA